MYVHPSTKLASMSMKTARTRRLKETNAVPRRGKHPRRLSIAFALCSTKQDALRSMRWIRVRASKMDDSVAMDEQLALLSDVDLALQDWLSPVEECLRSTRHLLSSNVGSHVSPNH